MILRIQTLYFFMIFALGSMLFMQNPIVNELSYQSNGEVFMEFTQFWSGAAINTDTPRPIWKTDTWHCVMLSLLTLSGVLAIFLSRRIKIQMVLCVFSMLNTLFLLSSLLIRFRLRTADLGSTLIDYTETPHLLWFGLLFAFQFSAMRILWSERNREIPK